jgi:hypothetical protein
MDSQTRNGAPTRPERTTAESSPARPAVLRPTDRIGLALFSVVVAILYLPAIDRWIEGDDFRNQIWAVFDRFDIFSNKGRYFRPVENLVNALNTWLVGPDHNYVNTGFSIAGLILSTWLVMRIARQIFPTSAAYPLLAGGYLALHTLSVSPTVQIDTISQQYATVFSLAALAWFLSPPIRRAALAGVMGAAFCVLALGSKESSLGVVLALPGVVPLLLDRSTRLQLRSLWPKAIRLVPWAAIAVVVYLAGRVAVGTMFWGSTPEGGQELSADPVYALKNAVLLLGPTVYIGSTLDFLPYFQPARLALGAGLSLALLGVALVGATTLLRREGGAPAGSPSVQIVLGLVLLILASLFPVCLFNDYLFELWTYGQLPFASLLLWMLVTVGWGVITRRLTAPAIRWAGAAVVAVIAIVLVAGVREKVRLAVETGRESRIWYEAAIDAVRASPPGRVKLCIPREPTATAAVETVAADRPLASLHSQIADRQPGHYHIYYRTPDDYLSPTLSQFLTRLHPGRDVRFGTKDCVPFETRVAPAEPDTVERPSEPGLQVPEDGARPEQQLDG